MSKNSKKLVGMAILVALAIIAFVVFQNIPSLSVIGAPEGIEYEYNYAPFNEDYINIVSEVSSFPDTTATFQLYHESDQHYPIQNISFEKCGQGGAWADYLNEVCYYDIHQDQRIVYVEGTCTIGTDNTIYDSTEILFLNDDIKAIECIFPDDMNISNLNAVQYKLDVKLTFTPICDTNGFDKDACVNSLFVQPFKEGGYIVRYDTYGCENYLCTTEWQTQNIAIGLLSIVLVIIILQIGLRLKRGAL